MASENPPASSSHHTFTHSQAAPIAPPIQAASPPTKQSLKTWWKGFRPPQKAQETPGNSPSLDIQSFVGGETYYASTGFVSKLPKDLPPIFQESAMDGKTPAVDGLPHGGASPTSPITRETIDSAVTAQYGLLGEEASPASLLPQPSVGSAPTIAVRQSEEASPASSSPQASNKCFVLHACGLQKLLYRNSRRQPSSILSSASKEEILPQEISSTNANAKQRFVPNKEETDSPSGTLIAGLTSEGNTPGGAGILPNPNTKTPCFFHITPNLFRPKFYVVKIAKYFKAPGHQGIFGVPLRESITYANVAISLVDSEGKSYIYGYVPIVVAKCGVYLKEKGMYRFLFCVRGSLLILAKPPMSKAFFA